MNKLFLFSLICTLTYSTYGQEGKPKKAVLTPKTELKSAKDNPSQTKTVSTSNGNDNATSYPKTYKVDVSGEQIEMDKAYYQQQLVNVNYLIQSIDSKVEYIKSSPEEDAQAIATGWYQQMENNKKDAEAKKIELAKKIESFN